MRWGWVLVAVLLLLHSAPSVAEDDNRPDNIRPWVPPATAQPRSFDSRQTDIDRARSSARARRTDHEATQYRSDLAGTRFRLERENRSDRRSFDRLQRLRREENRIGR